MRNSPFKESVLVSGRRSLTTAGKYGGRHNKWPPPQGVKFLWSVLSRLSSSPKPGWKYEATIHSQLLILTNKKLSPMKYHFAAVCFCFHFPGDVLFAIPTCFSGWETGENSGSAGCPFGRAPHRPGDGRPGTESLPLSF